jgi:hypothetical protein
MYDGHGRGNRITAFEGISEESLDDALRAAVNASDVRDGSTLVLTHLEVTTVGDPNIGSYRVILTKAGSS